MTQNLINFLRVAETDERSQDRMASYTGLDQSEFRAKLTDWAKEYDIDLTESDFVLDTDFSQVESEELDEEDLVDISGGQVLPVLTSVGKDLLTAIASWFTSHGGAKAGSTNGLNGQNGQGGSTIGVIGKTMRL